MSGSRAVRAAGLVMAVLLTACAFVPRKELNTDFSERNWGIRRSNIAAVQNFVLKGRVAEAGITGGRGDLDWTQAGDHLDLRISGPLGVGALAISGDRESVEIRSKDGTVTTRDPASYMQQQLGWSLPLSTLRYWALGVPAPGLIDDQPREVLLDDVGRALRFDQFGWRIEYIEYQSVNSLSLPRKLSLASGGRTFRLVVDQWIGTP
ncbi:lipoprotein insertase outer membrane protein LolB [Nevskia sp.]|uniref:lipoprotein insertase outer membrane protein LolB n=1 Tax=Nevskia sp. TaxID=1929292 RepID=UPI0025D0C86A|nr:lipoprotein insertase outer membrane protein LolB [Nevskia sp.]